MPSGGIQTKVVIILHLCHADYWLLSPIKIKNKVQQLTLLFGFLNKWFFNIFYLTRIPCKDSREGSSQSLAGLNFTVSPIQIAEWSISSLISWNWFQGYLKYSMLSLCYEKHIIFIEIIFPSIKYINHGCCISKTPETNFRKLG